MHVVHQPPTSDQWLDCFHNLPLGHVNWPPNILTASDVELLRSTTKVVQRERIPAAQVLMQLGIHVIDQVCLASGHGSFVDLSGSLYLLAS
jgi:hypothetical protein